MTTEANEIITRILNQSGKKFYLKIEIESKENDDKFMKIIVSDGKNVWESTKLSWKDLVSLKPDGIEESVQSASISLAILGKKSLDQSELKEEDLVFEINETGSGNLNISWKLKQILGITIVLGAIILLKLSESDSSAKILEILEQSALASNLQAQLKESMEFNKKLMEEYEKVVREKVDREEELYSKFRILLNKIKDQ